MLKLEVHRGRLPAKLSEARIVYPEVVRYLVDHGPVQLGPNFITGMAVLTDCPSVDGDLVGVHAPPADASYSASPERPIIQVCSPSEPPADTDGASPVAA